MPTGSVGVWGWGLYNLRTRIEKYLPFITFYKNTWPCDRTAQASEIDPWSLNSVGSMDSPWLRVPCRRKCPPALSTRKLGTCVFEHRKCGSWLYRGQIGIYKYKCKNTRLHIGSNTQTQIQFAILVERQHFKGVITSFPDFKLSACLEMLTLRGSWSI